MIEQILWVSTDGVNPHENLALEEALFQYVDDHTLVFYLWQNQHTVVIGSNQNAMRECKVNDLHQDNGTLARRLSGGGAVYHDLGNLNFTFLMASKHFDVNKQSEVLLKALKSFGIDAYARGRNDLLVDEKKFSGHAYYHHNNKSYHHGTLMVDVNLNELSKYLNVSKLKLEGKGVKSVISRVTNLIDYAPELTINNLKEALLKSVEEVYRAPLKELTIDQIDLEPYTKKYSSHNWLFKPSFDATTILENRFDWGEISIHLNLNQNTISEVQVYSDAMDSFLPSKLINCLSNIPFSRKDINEAIMNCGIIDEIIPDILSLFDFNPEEAF